MKQSGMKSTFAICIITGVFQVNPAVSLQVRNGGKPAIALGKDSEEGLVDLVDGVYPYESTWDPRETPISAVDRHRIEKANNGSRSSCSQGTATYGETEPEGQIQVLKAVGAKPGQRYYDLGAGLGRNVLVAWLWGMEATGVELSHEMFDYSCQRMRNVSAHNEKSASVLASVRGAGNTLKLVEGDVAQYDFSDGDVVFMNDKCWSDQLVQMLHPSLAKLKSGALVVSHKRLSEERLMFVKTVSAFMSWTLEPMQFNVYRAKGPRSVPGQGNIAKTTRSQTEVSCGVPPKGKPSSL